MEGGDLELHCWCLSLRVKKSIWVCLLLHCPPQPHRLWFQVDRSQLPAALVKLQSFNVGVSFVQQEVEELDQFQKGGDEAGRKLLETPTNLCGHSLRMLPPTDSVPRVGKIVAWDEKKVSEMPPSPGVSLSGIFVYYGMCIKHFEDWKNSHSFPIFPDSYLLSRCFVTVSACGSTLDCYGQCSMSWWNCWKPGMWINPFLDNIAVFRFWIEVSVKLCMGHIVCLFNSN